MNINKRIFIVIMFLPFASLLAATAVVIHPDPLNGSVQTLINDYLASKGKLEDVTGIATSIFLPKQTGALEGKIKTYYTGTQGLIPYNRLVSKTTLFQIGSITKSYVAAILLQLEGEGKLSLDDSLGKWLPTYKQWSHVTITQLLNMTSRIPSYSKNKDFDEVLNNNLQKKWSNDQLLHYADPQAVLDNKIHFDYSNTNYILAALIIEQVTHDSFANQLQKRILDPFNLKNTFYPDLNNQELYLRLQPRLAHGYFYDRKEQRLIDITRGNLSWAGAAGALIADMPDVIRWVQYLYHGRLFAETYRQSALQKLTRLVSMSTGKPINNVSAQDPKGFGLGIGYYYDEKMNNRFWIYEGSTLGYRVMYILSACNNVTVALALNSKAGEGDAKSAQGDGILQLTMDIYKTIIERFPTYACQNP